MNPDDVNKAESASVSAVDQLVESQFQLVAAINDLEACENGRVAAEREVSKVQAKLQEARSKLHVLERDSNVPSEESVEKGTPDRKKKLASIRAHRRKVSESKERVSKLETALLNSTTRAREATEQTNEARRRIEGVENDVDRYRAATRSKPSFLLRMWGGRAKTASKGVDAVRVFEHGLKERIAPLLEHAELERNKLLSRLEKLDAEIRGYATLGELNALRESRDALEAKFEAVNKAAGSVLSGSQSFLERGSATLNRVEESRTMLEGEVQGHLDVIKSKVEAVQETQGVIDLRIASVDDLESRAKAALDSAERLVEGSDRIRELESRCAALEQRWKSDAKPPEPSEDQLLLHSASHGQSSYPVTWFGKEPAEVQAEELVTNLRSNGFILENEVAAKLLDSLRMSDIVLLGGVAGTGKTLLSKCLANILLGADTEPYEFESMRPTSTEEEFIGGRRLDGRHFVPLLGAYFRSLCRCHERQGRCWLILDEFNHCDAGALFSSLSAAYGVSRGEIDRVAKHPFAFPERVGDHSTEVPIPDCFRVIGTMNDSSNEVFGFTEALSRRMSYVEIPVLVPELERELCLQELNAKQAGDALGNEHLANAAVEIASLMRSALASVTPPRGHQAPNFGSGPVVQAACSAQSSKKLKAHERKHTGPLERSFGVHLSTLMKDWPAISLRAVVEKLGEHGGYPLLTKSVEQVANQSWR